MTETKHCHYSPCWYDNCTHLSTWSRVFCSTISRSQLLHFEVAFDLALAEDTRMNQFWCLKKKFQFQNRAFKDPRRVSRLRERVVSDSWLHQCHWLLSVARGSIRTSMFLPLVLLNCVRALWRDGISASFQSLVSQFDGIYLPHPSFSLSSALLTDPRPSEWVSQRSFRHYSPSHAHGHQLPFTSSATDQSELRGINLRLLSCVILTPWLKAWMNFTIHQTFPFLLRWAGPKARRVHGTLVSASDNTPTACSLMSYSYCTQNWKTLSDQI